MGQKYVEIISKDLSIANGKILPMYRPSFKSTRVMQICLFINKLPVYKQVCQFKNELH